jgi:hypothetical protein
VTTRRGDYSFWILWLRPGTGLSSYALPTKLVFSDTRSALQNIGMTLPRELNDRVTEWLR